MKFPDYGPCKDCGELTALHTTVATGERSSVKFFQCSSCYQRVKA